MPLQLPQTKFLTVHSLPLPPYLSFCCRRFLSALPPGPASLRSLPLPAPALLALVKFMQAVKAAEQQGARAAAQQEGRGGTDQEMLSAEVGQAL